MMLDPHEKKWHYDSDRNRVCTMLQKRNPIMDSFRRRGLHLPRKETLPIGQEEVDMASFGDAAMALSGYQVAERQLYPADTTRSFPEFDDDGDSYPAVACPLIWDKCGDMAAQKSGLGQ